MKSRKNGGFTLIELMIVVAIVSILAAIAYPSYRESVSKGKRGQARAALAEFMQQQERYLTQNNTYYNLVPATGQNATIKNYAGDSFAGAVYTIQTQLCSGETTFINCIKAVATPVQSDPRVTLMTITSTGVKTCTPVVVADTEVCWK